MTKIKLTKAMQNAWPIFQILNNNTETTRFVGGSVRDAYLNIENNDIDLATIISIEDVLVMLNNNNVKVIPTGLQHGTITAICNNQNIEITTLRQDTLCDGRHANIVYTKSWELDSSRRDFTVNALYADYEGNIYDYHNGVSDLENSVVKFIGNPNDRIKEDYLRILRFFRFTAKFAKNIDTFGLKACKEELSGFKIIAGERIKREMFKLLAINSDNFVNTIRVMQDIGFLKYINIENINIANLDKLVALEKELYIDINIYNRFIVIIYNTANFLNQLKLIRNQWKLSNKENKYLQLTNDVFIEISKSKEINDKLLKTLIFKYGYDVLLSATILYDINNHTNHNNIKNVINLSKLNFIPLPINGNDIIKLGIEPGVKIGHYLDLALDYWIESNFKLTKAQLLTLIKKLIN